MRNKFMFVIALIITFTFTASHSFAGDDFEKAMLKAKKNLKSAMDNNDEAKLIKARGQFERILQLKKQLWLVNYYIALSDYGLAMEGMSKESSDKIKKYTQSGINVINKSIDENPEFADSYVLLEALKGTPRYSTYNIDLLNGYSNYWENVREYYYPPEFDTSNGIAAL